MPVHRLQAKHEYPSFAKVRIKPTHDIGLIFVGSSLCAGCGRVSMEGGRQEQAQAAKRSCLKPVTSVDFINGHLNSERGKALRLPGTGMYHASATTFQPMWYFGLLAGW